METPLDAFCVRVLGALAEKALTTPDYYPLSRAALLAACNQKSSRDPVMNMSEEQLEHALDTLLAAHLVRERSSAGARVSKFAHRLDDELGLRYGFDRAQLAVLSLLMLRGPQTAGELRARSSRMHGFADIAAFEHVLEGLASAERGPFVRQLPREPGRRESRFQELFSADPGSHSEVAHDVSAPEPAEDETGLEERVAALEREVAALRTMLESIRRGE